MQSTSTSQTPNSIQTVQNIANQSTTEIPTPTSALTTQPAKNTASQSPTGMPTPTSDLTTQSAQNTTSLSPTVMTTPANYLTTQSARNTILSTTVMPASLISGGHTTKMPSTPTLHSTVPTHGGPGHKSKEKAFPLEAVAIPSAIGGLFLLIIWVVIIVAMCRRRRKKEDRRASKRSRNDTEVSELSTDDQQGSFRQVPIPRPQLTLDSAVKPLYSGFLSPSQPNPYSFYDPYKSDGYFRV
ncbi:uncharacterized protein LOC135462774 [Liolophura sinensis]|uniref:uncharacterized protein LOC135462774 n=1 Tax=Liolophura sinensis TaxID=3198878 RepID=UPI0031580BF4